MDANDKVIPQFLAQQFVAGLSDNTRANMVILPNQEHGCCWERMFSYLLEKMTKAYEQR